MSIGKETMTIDVMTHPADCRASKVGRIVGVDESIDGSVKTFGSSTFSPISCLFLQRKGAQLLCQPEQGSRGF